ncbi:hypothetical protein LAZ67_5003385 [Cordylochernes scorpioides]|uniref:Peptidase A2 domain-containing protein n=1 Tax=Cordylochernes scorpioides TaxID=51811 RepID=A0ABY6KK77_9ARAC|nr:hypothetical protein LAZ67_5003385 [Cordylochernes scorpioides]
MEHNIQQQPLKEWEYLESKYLSDKIVGVVRSLWVCAERFDVGGTNSKPSNNRIYSWGIYSRKGEDDHICRKSYGDEFLEYEEYHSPILFAKEENYHFTILSSSQTSHNVMENLLEKISSLEKQVAEINLSRSRPSFRTQRQRSRSSSRIHRKYDPNGSFCYYHFRFGARCIPEKCKPPCKWVINKTQKSGKLHAAVEDAAHSTADNLNSCCKYRLFIKDKNSGLQFLIDTGADVSIVPPNEKRKSDYKLYAANGSEIETYGIKILTLDLGLRRENFNGHLW